VTLIEVAQDCCLSELVRSDTEIVVRQGKLVAQLHHAAFLFRGQHTIGKRSIYEVRHPSHLELTKLSFGQVMGARNLLHELMEARCGHLAR
jgi:hypothetical protein